MNIERKTAPNALWAYLLQKDLPVSSGLSATPVVPPVAPVDRTNTSMRMLIHDMQATLERFSTRVDALVNNVKDAKIEVLNVSRISESERDRVLDEITDSSKRVQIELKACIGAPLQASALELIQKSQASVESSIQALDKRIDAIQTLIQSQNHSMHAIQDQQHAILTTVLPLLPLVQAFPLHVDQAKAFIADQVQTTIADNISPNISSLNNNVDSMKSTLSSLSASSNSMRMVPKSALEITPSRSENHSAHKRTNSWLSQDDIHPRRSQSTHPHSFARLHSPCIDHYKKPRLDGVLRTGSPQNAKQPSHTVKPPTENPPYLHRFLSVNPTPKGVSITNSNNHPAALWTRQTRRTPLADILLPAPINHVNAQFRNPTTQSSTQAPPQSDGQLIPLTRAQMAIPAPPMAVSIIPDVSTAAPESDDSVPLTNNRKECKIIPESAPAALPITPQPKAIKLEEVLRSPLKGYISIPSSPLSSLSPSPPVALQPILKTQTQRAVGRTAQRQVGFVTSSQVFIPPVSSCSGVPPVPPHDSASASMSLRDRRAKMSVVSYSASSQMIGFTSASKLGRTTSSAKRFIAVGSSSDEEG